MSTQQYSNALVNETSPYLCQHAHNPVQWYPWGKEALTLAKQQNKPILLSIGYSACHWCHVMAHESFEDLQTAKLMNNLFINIKVDREERPDLDKIYQIAHQLIVQRPGGWPLTMFLNPKDQYPFFGGTYFPPQARYNLPAFKDLLRKIYTFYHEHPNKVKEQISSLTAELQDLTPKNDDVEINETPLKLAWIALSKSFDKISGGFTGAPKFPQIPNLEYLLHHYIRTDESKGLDMTLLTLKKMAMGGIYDQLGGGFYRYSVDELWITPHFEKMLYDNGPFLSIYSEAWQLKEDDLYKRVTLETADWILREMHSPEGGFYSSLDADSEGEEGKFYTWRREKVKNLLHKDLYPLLAFHFGFNRAANFEGQWHLNIYHEQDKTAKKFKLNREEFDERLNHARDILFKDRQKRISPNCDKKILTSWNALMIKGMATAGRIFERQDYLTAAEQSLDFIKKNLWQRGRLLATYKDGKSHLNAYLDDYAFLLDAVLTLLQARWRNSDLTFAIKLADILLEQFADTKQGGFYFTAHKHENLITRQKYFIDESLPSGNGIAALALGRLGHLLGETRYLDAAEKTIHASWANLKESPSSSITMLLALENYLFPSETIILRGDPKTLQIWQTECQKHYAPQRLCFAIPNRTTNLPGILTEREPQGAAVAYICTGHQCRAPIMSLDELKKVVERR